MTHLAAQLRAVRVARYNRRTLLALLAIDAFDPATTLDVERLTAMPVGVLYTLLGDLETAGHITGEWATPDPDGIPRRRYYSVTESGRRRVTELAALLRSAPTEEE